MASLRRTAGQLPPWQVSYVDNPHMRDKREGGDGREGEGASPTEYTTGLLSSVRGEKSNLQEPNY
ncbi:hypothetical protein NQZ68_011398 [Dissostichus eleginoides]|nr:hypothetical protein NQZ68_011398 [Dissostichus eleginoides]